MFNATLDTDRTRRNARRSGRIGERISGWGLPGATLMDEETPKGGSGADSTGSTPRRNKKFQLEILKQLQEWTHKTRNDRINKCNLLLRLIKCGTRIFVVRSHRHEYCNWCRSRCCRWRRRRRKHIKSRSNTSWQSNYGICVALNFFKSPKQSPGTVKGFPPSRVAQIWQISMPNASQTFKKKQPYATEHPALTIKCIIHKRQNSECENFTRTEKAIPCERRRAWEACMSN